MTAATTTTAQTTAVVVDTSASPNAAHRPVPIGNVRLTDEFLAPRLRINRDVTIPSQFQHLEDTNRLRNFRRVAGEFDGPFDGIYFNDSDVYKWLEAAASAIAAYPGEDAAALLAMIETVVGLIEGAQDENGYLNTYFSVDLVAERWSNLRDKHELYCAGHFIQAAIAHKRATGDDRLMAVATKLADLIGEVFGPAADGKREQTDGHEEIELALIELYRQTGKRTYLDQARFFLDIRGTGTIGGSDYHQDATPIREQSTMVGHAVRAVYLNAGATDLLIEEDEPALRAALDRMWANMTTRRSYVSGGIGSRWEGEAFGKDFELPNERAYTESCAAIGAIMWAWRMLTLRAEDNTRYADWIEHALYNAMLPGLSLDGQAVLLPESARRRRRSSPPAVVRLRLLPAEHRAGDVAVARLFLLGHLTALPGIGWPSRQRLGPSLRRQHVDDPASCRGSGDSQAGHALSVGWSGRDRDRRSPGCRGFHAAGADSGLGRRRHGRDQRRTSSAQRGGPRPIRHDSPCLAGG